ncbi:phage tail protein [Acinetobacter vivianii]|uniref:Phage tail protein n=1 Tax=Acinetobacter vivianii TaxID=1776742 RepID=A0AAJ6NGG1_9GAMM|nr:MULTISPECIES: phage tail protein [Acinetobacter]RPE30854.1 hypothetical protein EC846_1555 [Acinetobacter sp. BIGb0102]WDZ49972.1 phage tail protein [Acinetobacter vivianii]
MANLVFKFNWEHRPYPYNAAQGKQQFMLPFASGIPNLTPDISQVQGVGTAATKNTGTSNGNVVEVQNVFGCAFSTAVDYYWSGTGTPTYTNLDDLPVGTKVLMSGVAQGVDNRPSIGSGLYYIETISTYQPNVGKLQTAYNYTLSRVAFRVAGTNNTYTGWREFWTTGNSAADSNGFIKAASPIVKLFANGIELNEEAKQQPIEFEKLGTGDYLLKGSLGFAQEGWYIEIPKDANGNTVVAVLYETLENGDISIKTYKRKFDFDIAAVVADLDNPLDIPAGRWIDVRLHEEPLPEQLINETPLEFQPTNLAQAVAAAMDGVEPPEIQDEPSNESL